MLPINIKKIPSHNECGGFGYKRKFDIHTGVDLYCKDGEPVYAMEDGIISNYGPFTGIGAGSDWWEDTDFICIKGKSGKILYGEIALNKNMLSKSFVKEGALLGHVKRVLKVDKGRPMTMLHIELYNEQYSGTGEIWYLATPKPKYLEDVTVILQEQLNKKKDRKKLIWLTIGCSLTILLLIIKTYLNE